MSPLTYNSTSPRVGVFWLCPHDGRSISYVQEWRSGEEYGEYCNAYDHQGVLATCPEFTEIDYAVFCVKGRVIYNNFLRKHFVLLPKDLRSFSLNEVFQQFNLLGSNVGIELTLDPSI